jgi:hypothetical protein
LSVIGQLSTERRRGRSLEMHGANYLFSDILAKERGTPPAMAWRQSDDR